MFNSKHFGQFFSSTYYTKPKNNTHKLFTLFVLTISNINIVTELTFQVLIDK